LALPANRSNQSFYGVPEQKNHQLKQTLSQSPRVLSMLDQQTSEQDGSLNLGKQPAKSIWKLPQNPAFPVNYSFY
jgi:hypothetical protein